MTARIAAVAAFLMLVATTTVAAAGQTPDTERSLSWNSHTCKGSSLQPGEILKTNEYICAYDPDDGSKIRFGLNFIGILLFYRDDKVIWSAKKRGDYLTFQEKDGHLVLYSAGGRVAWSTKCFGRARAKVAEINFSSGGTKPGLLLVDEEDEGIFFFGTDGFISGCYPDPKLLLTDAPTTSPTAMPTKTPTAAPTKTPTTRPTSFPTWEPTPNPTSSPTSRPPSRATSSPTSRPTANTVTAKQKPKPTRRPTRIAPFKFLNDVDVIDNEYDNIDDAGETTNLTQGGQTSAPTISPPGKVPTGRPTIEQEYVEAPIIKNEPGLTNFYVLGDAPYNDREMTHWVPRQIAKIPYDADFVFHAGNQMLSAASKCNIMWNKFMRDTVLAKSEAPVFITPGENDYVQCKGRIEDATDDVEAAWENWKQVYFHLDKRWEHDLPVVYQQGRQDNFSFLVRRTLVISLHMINEPMLDAVEWKKRHLSNYEFVKDRITHHSGNFDALVLLSHAKPTANHDDFWSKMTFTIVTDSHLKDMPIVLIHAGGNGIYQEEERFLNLKNVLRVQIEGRKRNPINIMVDTRSKSPIKIDRKDKTVWSTCCNPWLEGWPAP